MKVTPRTYQRVAVKAALKGLRSRLKRALLVLATGLGKTMTVAFTAKEMGAKRILFLVHNNFILKHAVDEFRMVFDEKTKMATFNGMSRNGAKTADIVFATWQTMGGNLKKWARNHFDLVIVDEAHHSEAETYRPVAKYFTGAKLGITATPDREDKADIRDIFGKEVVNITLEEAIARGWLPRIEYHVITDESLDDKALQEITEEIRESKKRFTMAEVNRRIFIKKRDTEIARIIAGYNEKTIVFCASIEHAERMAKSLPLCSSFHSGKGASQGDTWAQNQETLDHLKNGIIRRVCAVNAFNEGVNVPTIGLAAFCRVTGSLTIFRQQLGRGLRPGKDKLIVLDFVGNLERIQLLLEMMNRISDLHEQFTPRGEIEREGYTSQKFEVSGKGFEFTFSDKVVDLMKVLEHCERELYPTWQEASQAAIKLGIKSKMEYRERYKEDAHLPSFPLGAYDDFPGMVVFLGGVTHVEPYTTWQQASHAVKKLGIQRSGKPYAQRYREDAKLPASPRVTYPDYPGDNVFFGTPPRRGNLYKTWQQASKAAIKLKIRTFHEYLKRYKEDPKLPSSPHNFKDFPGWGVFLGTGAKPRKDRAVFYKTWQEASRAVKKHKLKRGRDYKVRYRVDPKLPSNPWHIYKDYPGHDVFFGTK